MASFITLEELAEAWNQLRNAALGRGTTPLVGAELANEVASAYEEFRAWLAEQGPFSAMLDTSESQAWLERHNQLSAEVARYAPAPEPLPETATESVITATERADRVVRQSARELGQVAESSATALAVAAIGAAAVWLLSKRRGG